MRSRHNRRRERKKRWIIHGCLILWLFCFIGNLIFKILPFNDDFEVISYLTGMPIITAEYILLDSPRITPGLKKFSIVYCVLLEILLIAVHFLF